MKSNIIVVDDSLTSLELLTQILSDEGFGVHSFTDGNKAMTFARQNPPDIFLLDIMMPETSGYRLCQILKQDNITRDIPVIFISAKNDISDKIKAFSIGGVDYISKPFQVDEVVARVNTHLKLRQLQQNLEKKNDELASTLAELKATQHQLIRHEKLAALGKLSAGIAHEIKNPLNFINSFARLNLDRTRDLISFIETEKLVHSMQNGTELFEIIHDMISNSENIVEEGQRADKIILSILHQARDSSTKAQSHNINDLVKEAIKMAHHDMRHKDYIFHTSVNTEFDNQIPELMVMAQALSQVLVNLIDNACYAMVEKRRYMGNNYVPQLTVSTSNHHDHIEIKIRDNGMGIPQNALEKIFDPFFTTKPPGHGAGLGLTISHDIICQGHGGEMSAKSQEGHYTEMLIRLPKSRL